MIEPNAASTPLLPGSNPGNTASSGAKSISSWTPVLFVSNPKWILLQMMMVV